MRLDVVRSPIHSHGITEARSPCPCDKAAEATERFYELVSLYQTSACCHCRWWIRRLNARYVLFLRFTGCVLILSEMLAQKLEDEFDVVLIDEKSFFLCTLSLPVVLVDPDHIKKVTAEHSSVCTVLHS